MFNIVVQAWQNGTFFLTKLPMKPSALFWLAAFALAGAVHAEVVTNVPAARTLISQGAAFQEDGKLNEALASYRAAAKADPRASEPLSYLALLMIFVSQNTDAKYVEQYREQAQTYAREALKVDERDPNAMEALRQLADGVPQQRRQPLPAAFQALREGELLFGERKYAEAAMKYQQARRLDPDYADAVVFLGDCFYMQGDMPRAEEKFRQATVMDPLYGAAWRYLYDALKKQGKQTEAAQAAYGALASQPSSVPNWQRVVAAMHDAGRGVTRFKWQPKASMKGREMQIDPGAPASDGLAWMAYALSAAAQDKGDMGEAGKKQSAFTRELEIWKSTLQIISETGNADKIKDEGLREMIRFHKGGQLQAALFALHYKESFRADFEAWKKAEPEGLKRFVETFRVGL